MKVGQVPLNGQYSETEIKPRISTEISEHNE